MLTQSTSRWVCYLCWVMKFYLGPLGTVAFLFLSIGLLTNVGAAIAFLFRLSNNKRADYFQSVFHFAFALTCLHLIFIVQGIYSNYKSLLFLPVYNTLSLGPFLFYSIKLRLFPSYRFVPSDAKHFILPIGQFLYFSLMFLFTSPEFRYSLGRKFYSPFYGGLEMAIFIITFNIYMAAAYRFIRFRIARDFSKHHDWDWHQTLQLRRMIRVLFILFFFNSVYILTDFIMYELLRLNMHNFRGFTRSGEIVFATMAIWIGWMGFVILRKKTYKSISDAAWQFIRKLLLGMKSIRQNHGTSENPDRP